MSNLPAPSQLDRPVEGDPPVCGWGSDVIALALRALELPYIALNPGASYRGLHDSLVNFLGNRAPQMLVTLHETHAVAIAHGYAKVTGRPMAAMTHSNVGLMNAAMAVFNAWCDRVPLVLLGATGPVDADRRRPWIDWIHTAADQAALIRNFIKWDNQPASVPAAIEALHRANAISRTAPHGPVYVCLDASLQEARLAQPIALPDPGRFRPPKPPEPSAEAVREAAALLRTAARPVVLSGRIARTDEAWARRRLLCERLGARVLTDQKAGASFPTEHPLHVAPPMFFVSPDGRDILRDADVILALDWIDLGGTLRSAFDGAAPAAKVIHASCDSLVHNGWSMDHHALPPVDVALFAPADRAVDALLAVLPETAPYALVPTAAPQATVVPGEAITMEVLAATLRAASAGETITLTRVATGWPTGAWPYRGPLDYLGGDGGAGVGSGPGIAVGAALALVGTDRLPVAVLGDGDYLMGVSALWTAARYRLPLLIVVANNRSFFNDELHQDAIARARGRPPENRWIGQRLDDPAPDIAGLARAQGLLGLGPVATPDNLAAALRQAVRQARDGRSVVVDVLVAASHPGVTRAVVRPGERN